MWKNKDDFLKNKNDIKKKREKGALFCIRRTRITEGPSSIIPSCYYLHSCSKFQMSGLFDFNVLHFSYTL